MCVWQHKGELEAVSKGGRILRDPLWCAVGVSARVTTKQASVEKAEKEAEGSDNLGRGKGEADDGARAPRSPVGCPLWLAKGM